MLCVGRSTREIVPWPIIDCIRGYMLSRRHRQHVKMGVTTMLLNTSSFRANSGRQMARHTRRDIICDHDPAAADHTSFLVVAASHQLGGGWLGCLPHVLTVGSWSHNLAGYASHGSGRAFPGASPGCLLQGWIPTPGNLVEFPGQTRHSKATMSARAAHWSDHIRPGPGVVCDHNQHTCRALHVHTHGRIGQSGQFSGKDALTGSSAAMAKTAWRTN